MNEDLRNLERSDTVVFIIGQSGSGKGTLVRNLNELFKKAKHSELSPLKSIWAWFREAEVEDIYLSDTGALLRGHIPLMTKEVGRLIGNIQSQGKLQSPSVAASLCINNFLYEYEGGIAVIDGSPRTIFEAEILIDFFHSLGKNIFVLNLLIDDEEALKRMKERNKKLSEDGGQVRTDSDSDEKLKTKMQFYHDQVVPTVDYLVNRKDIEVHNVDANQLPDFMTNQAVYLLLQYYQK